MTGSLALRFPISEVSAWASRYSYLPGETRYLEEVRGPRSRAAGFISRPDFLAICEWKSKRQRRRYADNDPVLIEETTRLALSVDDERLRVGVLLILKGVSWPTASTLLHFAHRDPYPILDFRALWSLQVGVIPPTYDFELWWTYVTTCRRLADEARVSIRELDRALWQFSKENQRTVSAAERDI